MLYDRDIREPLFEYLENRYGKIRIIEEKNMGRSRADIVMVLEDALVGIEIKSDADTYARLERQVQDYNTFFDYNMVVIGSSHAQHISEHVPKEWGIITVERIEQNVDFYLLRAMKNNTNMKPEKKLSILWRPELAHIQTINHMAKYKEKSKAFVVKKIITSVPQKKLWTQVSEELFERDYDLIEEQINAYRTTQGQRKRTHHKKLRK